MVIGSFTVLPFYFDKCMYIDEHNSACLLVDYRRCNISTECSQMDIYSELVDERLVVR